jgi:biotin-(acetyl-CoA carboxylase) ligase
MLSQPVQVNDVSGVISGVAEGVEDNGALLIRLQNGALRRIIAGDLALG